MVASDRLHHRESFTAPIGTETFFAQHSGTRSASLLAAAAELDRPMFPHTVEIRQEGRRSPKLVSVAIVPYVMIVANIRDYCGR